MSWCVFDVAGQEREIASLDEQSAQPDFWQNAEQAQETMRRLSALKVDASAWRSLEHRARDAFGLLELAAEAGDANIVAEIEQEAAAIKRDLEQREFRLMLSGSHDRNSAILAIHAGAGGTESQDWAAMLLRMFTRWAERKDFRVGLVDETPGEEAGIKSVTLEISGEYAYGYLKGEMGVHRLVRLSPFDSAHRRHTSFALVEVMPELSDDMNEIEIRTDEVKMDVFRSSGAGGQNVQKTSTAVRLTHLPTGIVVTCQNERSQVQNRETAMKVLKSRLYELAHAEREEEIARIKGKHGGMGFGNQNQVRSYVLHPYQMAKDQRTDFETSNTQGVLDGDLDPFIEAYLRRQMPVGR
ncbi:MAG: peptide chain release factor 2 [Chloroflexi bacterium]|nr:peptide chain release factor 2 [Chloroflexota bacterium]